MEGVRLAVCAAQTRESQEKERNQGLGIWLLQTGIISSHRSFSPFLEARNFQPLSRAAWLGVSMRLKELGRGEVRADTGTRKLLIAELVPNCYTRTRVSYYGGCLLARVFRHGTLLDTGQVVVVRWAHSHHSRGTAMICRGRPLGRKREP